MPFMIVLIISTMPKPNKQSKQQQKTAKQQKKQTKQIKQQEVSSQQSENADIDLNHLEGQTQQMEVSFIIGEIQEDYYHSLKTILLRFANIAKTTNSEVADAVVGNRNIGNVVLADDDDEDEDQEQEQEQEQDDGNGQDDEENVYAVLSVFSGKSSFSKKIRSNVLKIIEKKDFPEQVTDILKACDTGLILNERLANLPAFVVNSAHQVFKKDMMELKVKQPKRYFELFSGYLLNISEVQYEGEEDLEKLIYSKFQDFEMCKRARVWWIGGSNSSYKKKADMRNLYYLIKPQEYFAAIDNIKTYLEE